MTHIETLKLNQLEVPEVEPSLLGCQSSKENNVLTHESYSTHSQYFIK